MAGVYSTERNYPGFVAFDLETTGMGNAMITEIGAVKVQFGEVIDRFDALVDPGEPIPYFITELTGITNEMVRGQPEISQVLPRFLTFAEDLPLVAHNAPFDASFLRREAAKLGIVVENPIVDTLRLARRVFPRLPSYKLTFLTDYFDIRHDHAHRASSDAEAAAKLYLMMREV